MKHELRTSGKAGSVGIFATVVICMMIVSAIPITFNSDNVSADESLIKTVQSPYSYVNYYNEDGSQKYKSEKYYNTQTVDVKFSEILPSSANGKIFMGWSETKNASVAQYYISQSTPENPLQGVRNFTMGGENRNLYAVWFTGTTMTVSSGSPGVSLNTYQGIIVSNGATALTVTGGSAAGTYYIILNNVSTLGRIDLSGATGTIKIQFNGTNTITRNSEGAAIKTGSSVNTVFEGKENAKLTLSRDNTKDSVTSAVLGSDGGDSGNIQIESGEIIVNNRVDYTQGAGIGAGQGGDGRVVINGGKVTVTTYTNTTGSTGLAAYNIGANGAGIGGGSKDDTSSKGAGIVTITGGEVTVSTTTNGRTLLGAGIGGGGNVYNPGPLGTARPGGDGIVKITGGKVDVTLTCNGGSQIQAKAAAIGGGGGYEGSAAGKGGQGNINISGGTITTKSNKMSATYPEIGSGRGGAAPTITVTGGSINGTMNVPTGLSKYVLNASTTSGNAIGSVYVRRNGSSTYADYNISYHHTGSTNFYIYAPSTGVNLVSLEFGSSGRVLYYGDTTAGATALNTSSTNPSPNTYYRAEYYLNGLTLDNNKSMINVHHQAGSNIIDTLSLTDSNKVPPVMFVDDYTGGSQTLYDIRDGIDDHSGKALYDRNSDNTSGTVEFYGISGKHVVVANSITGYNVEYALDPSSDPGSAVFAPGNPNKFGAVDEKVTFKVEPAAGYLITNITWTSRLDSSDSLSVKDFGVEGIYDISNPQSSIVITVETTEAYDVESEIKIQDPNSGNLDRPQYVGPSRVPYGDGFSFTVSEMDDFEIIDVTWRYKGTAIETEVSFNDTYEFDVGANDADIMITIYMKEVREVTFTVPVGAIVYYTVNGGDPVYLLPGDTDYDIQFDYGSSIEVTIAEDDPEITGLPILEVSVEDGSGEDVWELDDTPYPGAVHLLDGGYLENYCSVIILTEPSYIIKYDDTPPGHISYVDGDEKSTAPNTILKTEDTLEITLHKMQGYRLSEAVYEIGTSGETPIDIVDNGDGTYTLEIDITGLDIYGSNVIYVYLTTAESWNVVYIYDPSEVEFDGPLQEYIDAGVALEFSARSCFVGPGKYRMYEVAWNIQGQATTTSIDGTAGSSGYTDYVLDNESWASTAVIEITLSITEYFDITTTVYLDGTVALPKDYGTLFSDFTEPMTTANLNETITFSTTANDPYRISDVQFRSGTGEYKQLTPLVGSKTTTPIVADSTIDIYLVTTRNVVYEGDADDTDIVSFIDEAVNKKPTYVDINTDLEFTANPVRGYIIIVEYKIGETGSYTEIDPAAGGRYTVLAGEIDDTVYIKITGLEVYYLTVIASDVTDLFTLKVDNANAAYTTEMPVLKDLDMVLTKTATSVNRVFLGWTVDIGSPGGSDTGVFEFTMSSDMTIFLLSEDKTSSDLVTLTLTDDPSGKGSFTYKVYGNVMLEYTAPIYVMIDTTVTVLASGEDSYSFLRWTDNVAESMNAGRSFTFAVGGSQTKTALFAADVVVLKLDAYPIGIYGDVVIFVYKINGVGTFATYLDGIRLSAGDTVQIGIIEDDGELSEIDYSFLRWNDGLADKSRSYAYWPSAEGGNEKTLTAIYADNADIVTVSVMVNKDDNPWTDFIGTVALKQSGVVMYYTDLHVNGEFTFRVLDASGPSPFAFGILGLGEEFEVFVNDVSINKQINTSTMPSVDADYYTSTVTINKDDLLWEDYEGEIKLNGKIPGKLIDGVFYFGVLLEDAYNVYVGDFDTGVVLTVNAGTASATVDYYTVTLTAKKDGSAVSPSITADVSDGDIVLKGTKVKAEASATGASGDGWKYEYAWSDGSDKKTAEFTIDASNKDIECTVKGIDGTFTATVNVMLDGIAVYTAFSGTIQLEGTDGKKESMTGTDGIFELKVLADVYKVLADGVDTKVTITVVKDGSPTEEVDYYTVTLTGVPDGTAISVDMTADISITDPILKGTEITVTAKPAGAEGSSSGYMYAWSNNTSAENTVVYEIDATNKDIVCTVFGVDGTFTATVTVKLDNGEYKGFTAPITLKQFGSVKYTAYGVDGIFVFNASAGTYDVFVGDDDTGVNIAIDNSGSSAATVNYYTVTLSADKDGTATSASVSSDDVTTGDIVLEGTEITVTATGNGASGDGFKYTYVWSNNVSTANTVVYNVSSANKDIECTVKGIDGTFVATVNVNLDGTIYTAFGGDIVLEKDGTEYPMAGTDGIFKLKVLAETYKVLADGVDTKVTITVVKDGAPTVTVDYYTVTLADTPEGTATSVDMTADIDLTDPVLKGTVITVTATPAGASGDGFKYTYAWSNNVSTANTAEYTIGSANKGIECTVTGTDGTFVATVTVDLDGIVYGGFSEDIVLKQSGDVKYTESGVAGVFTFNALAETYNVFVGDVDTGVKITIDKSGTSNAVVDYYTVTLTATHKGDATGATVTSSITSGDVVLKGTEIIVTAAGEGAGVSYYTYVWSNNDSDIDQATYTIDASNRKIVCTVTGHTGPVPIVYYDITATAGLGAEVSPSGTVSVEKGTDKMFTFGSAAGYVISSVTVDGVSLSSEELALGYYTFYNVTSVHTIDVVSTPATYVFEVNIVEGEGRVEYSIDGGDIIVYTSKVTVYCHSSIVIRAFADDGYTFEEWVVGSVTITDEETAFLDIDHSIIVEVHFSDGASDIAIWFLLSLSAILGAVLLYMLFCYFRSYEVVKVSSTANIVGSDTARRNRSYTFSLMGAEGGEISYRVGDNEQLRHIMPDESGEYTIPGKHVKDKLTIEHR